MARRCKVRFPTQHRGSRQRMLLKFVVRAIVYDVDAEEILIQVFLYTYIREMASVVVVGSLHSSWTVLCAVL